MGARPINQEKTPTKTNKFTSRTEKAEKRSYR